MNITEKRRAELMVAAWRDNKLAEHKAPGIYDNISDLPKDIVKEVEEVEKAARELKAKMKKVQDKGYVFNGLDVRLSDIRLRFDSDNPEFQKRSAEAQTAKDIILAKAKRLIVEVWDGKHTFATLAEELK